MVDQLSNFSSKLPINLEVYVILLGLILKYEIEENIRLYNKNRINIKTIEGI